MLDKTKDYGECGANSYGWKYYQNGKYFNLKGEELSADGEIIEETTESTPSPLKAPLENVEPKPIPKPRGRRKSISAAPLGAKK